MDGEEESAGRVGVSNMGDLWRQNVKGKCGSIGSDQDGQVRQEEKEEDHREDS